MTLTLKQMPSSLSYTLSVPFPARKKALSVPFPALSLVPFLLLSSISWEVGGK
jgi:hypothetical protein